MKRIILASTALTALTAAANAGGLERTPQSVAILFEEGRYMELSFGYVSPDVSGTLGGAPSGNMLDNYFNLGAAYKADLNETLSYAIIFDQPYGADTAYPTGTGYPFAGSTAKVRSNALSGILQYNMGNGGSVYGGLRLQSLHAEANLPVLGSYTIDSNTDYQLGYLVGAAYERPDIALRVALTYHSEVTHELDLTEDNIAPTTPITTTQDVKLPQALNLEFQTGVAKDTLVFGSVRWAEWSVTSINPPVYDGSPGTSRPLVFYDDDRITYTLGVGRRINDTWSVLGSISYEETTGSNTGNLGPVDGFTSVSLGAIYRKDNMKITGGVRYIDIGDATTFSTAAFSDNSAVAAGLRIGWQF
jgi:long-subunit fatty acid transport protein